MQENVTKQRNWLRYLIRYLNRLVDAMTCFDQCQQERAHESTTDWAHNDVQNLGPVTRIFSLPLRKPEDLYSVG